MSVDLKKILPELNWLEENKKLKTKEECEKECPYILEKVPSLFELVYDATDLKYKETLNIVLKTFESYSNVSSKSEKDDIEKRLGERLAERYFPEGAYQEYVDNHKK